MKKFFTLIFPKMTKYKKQNKEKTAFTLAEILITITIIGIVAILVIPALVTNYQNRAWSTAATVFERKLTEAIKSMNSQETLSGYTTTEDFVNELTKYLKINKISKSNNKTSCFENKVLWGAENEEIDITTIKNASNFGQNDWDTETVGIQLANGTTGIIAYNPNCTQDPYNNQFNGLDCIAILYDTSGSKKPNESGKDLRSINVNSLGRSCAANINGICFGSLFIPEAISDEECETIKDDLGMTMCDTMGRDYWGGAVKACGGKANLPSKQQMIEIAKYLYNTDNIVSNVPSENLVLDIEKASKLGLTPLTNGQELKIWLNREASSIGFGGNMADLVRFGLNDFNPNNTASRSIGGYYAMCIIP